MPWSDAWVETWRARRLLKAKVARQTGQACSVPPALAATVPLRLPLLLLLL